MDEIKKMEKKFWWKVTFQLNSLNNIELLNHQLFELGATGIEEQGVNRLITYFEEEIEGLEDKIKVLKENKDLDVFAFRITKQERENWQENWKENFKPIEIPGKFLIMPPWEQSNPDLNPNLSRIVIEPNLAFGTGNHETTRIMLHLMTKERIMGKSVLDVGTGSGILSFASSILECSDVLGIDNDPVAVEYAIGNMKYNEDQNIEFDDASLQSLDQKYDIILMNIISSIQYQLFPDLVNRMSEKTQVITSGVLLSEREEYCAFLNQHHLKVIEEKTMGEWIGVRSCFFDYSSDM